MSPIWMTVLLVVGIAVFAWQMCRRWRLMRIGPDECRCDRIGERLKRTFTFAFAQKRMPRYPWAGTAHQIIFIGFLVLLLRSVTLFGRGYVEGFDLWILGHDTVLGMAYSFLKDFAAVLVIVAAGVFVYYRVIARPKRMTLSFEGLLIILIIEVMMFADILYDGAAGVEAARAAGEVFGFNWYEPAGSLAGLMLSSAGDGVLGCLKHAGFWTHVSLVLIFLNLLPISKHFHVITAIPNVFAQSLAPRGRLPNVEDIEGKIEREETLGLARIDQMSWKGVMDLYTCTECGRCTDQCPAANTGKKLSPKQLTLDLRNLLYKNEKTLVGGKPGEAAELVPDSIDPEVLWACTTCGACETECPVFITYVDKIVDMRRYLVMEKSEFPAELQNAFRGIETNSNPWSFPASDRAAWTEGLDVPLMRDKPDADVLFWVGCSASFDDRARKIARATASLLIEAGVSFAILGDEENCTGDAARRAGNEFLFQMMAEMNVETLNGYAPRKIITSCPHCFNTLLNEYPDFGGKFDVEHHGTFLSRLVAEGRLTPKRRIDARVAFHDSCYLGRYNDIYDGPRDALKAIDGLTILEPEARRDRGMCCGAGGAQMFKEEESGTSKVPVVRTEQLLETKPDVVASSCPFCQRMLIDGLADRGREDVEELDIAELLWRSIEPEAVAEPAATS